MPKTRTIWGITAIIIVCILAVTYYFIRPYLNAIKPVLQDSSEQSTAFIQELKNQIDDSVDCTNPDPFTVNEEFCLEVFSDEVKNPRVLIQDTDGNILISEPGQSRIGILTENGDYSVLLNNLNRPHGLAILEDKLYVAETGQVLEYDYENGEASNPRTLLDLPPDGRHWTRTIAFKPGTDELFISIGSSCNICIEDDSRRTTIMKYDLSTQALTTYATGLRNAVFFAWNDQGQLLATEMGRDWLGDDLPPDELNLIEEGKDYGYPYCYGKNDIDPEYDNASRCVNTEPSFYDFIAHEAPLGIDFLNGDAIIALHGSWNATNPVGYEVIRLLEESNYQDRDSIMSGFLLEDGSSIGRPAGILVLSDDSILISDDKEDVIYKLRKK